MSGSQETLVLQLELAAGRRLADALTAAGYLFRPVPHAVFSARGEGVAVTLYRSGKLVVQGQGLDTWQARHLPAAPLAVGGGAGDAALPERWPALGSDEAGKGDTFGPLVVAAVVVDTDAARTLTEMRVADSKTLRDERVRILAPRIRELLGKEGVAGRILQPATYNRLHREAGSNANRLLAGLHATLLARLQRRSGADLAIVDRFAGSRPVRRLLGETCPGLEVHEVPRAERHLAVAAASILAREGFLRGLRRLEEEWAVDLPRGSGAPVGPALRRFLAIHGPRKLGAVAKLHFRNVQAALARLPGTG